PPLAPAEHRRTHPLAKWNVQMNDFTRLSTDQASDPLTETIRLKLANPERSADFDFHAGADAVLWEVGMWTADGGGTLTFYGHDPIVPSAMKFGTMAAIGLAAKSVA